jgi:hypothetical protein
MTKISREEYNKLLIEETSNKKTEWGKTIREDVIPLIRTKDPNDMTDAQALGLSYRVTLLEEVGFFLNDLAETQRTMKKLKADRFCLYSTGLLPDGTRPTGNIINHPLVGNTRLSSSQKEMVISGDLADYEHTEEILKGTIEQLREYIKTIDNAMFAIKNRLEIFQILK